LQISSKSIRAFRTTSEYCLEGERRCFARHVAVARHHDAPIRSDVEVSDAGRGRLDQPEQSRGAHGTVRAREVAAAGDAARRLDASVSLLGNVLRTLGRAGLVESIRSVGGGHRLRGKPRRVTLLAIIELFEEDSPRARGAPEPGAAALTGCSVARRFIAAELVQVPAAALRYSASVPLITESNRWEYSEGADNGLRFSEASFHPRWDATQILISRPLGES